MQYNVYQQSSLAAIYYHTLEYIGSGFIQCSPLTLFVLYPCTIDVSFSNKTPCIICTFLFCTSFGTQERTFVIFGKGIIFLIEIAENWQPSKWTFHEDVAEYLDGRYRGFVAL